MLESIRGFLQAFVKT